MTYFAIASLALGAFLFFRLKLRSGAAEGRQGGLWASRADGTLMADRRTLADLNLAGIDDALYLQSYPVSLARTVVKAGS